ncbi:MAG: hypothetical protein LBS22_02845 [Puniceicoccales bacterium]|jgi:hypothetical protein|nr:hypothetical protein [Puniceicoccales bacterium]
MAMAMNEHLIDLNSAVKKRKTFAPRIYLLGNDERYKNFPDGENYLYVEKASDKRITTVIKVDDEGKIQNGDNQFSSLSPDPLRFKNR